jgi:hypothetical protein
MRVGPLASSRICSNQRGMSSLTAISGDLHDKMQLTRGGARIVALWLDSK